MGKPDVFTMRVFEATTYVHVPKGLAIKLEPVSRIGLLFGFDLKRRPTESCWRMKPRSQSARTSP
jgi:hypothetical protein